MKLRVRLLGECEYMHVCTPAPFNVTCTCTVLATCPYYMSYLVKSSHFADDGKHALVSLLSAISA
jgi:hypothetical protein